MAEKASEIWAKIKPFAVRDIGGGVSQPAASSSSGTAVHDLDGDRHIGTLSWDKLNFTNSDIADVNGELPWPRLSKTGSLLTDLENIEHDLIGPHAVTGAKDSVVALVAANTLGVEATGNNGALGNVLLRSGPSGELSLTTLNAANIDHASDINLGGTRLIMDPDSDVVNTGVQLSDNFDTGNAGARINWPLGDAEFRQLIVDSLYAEEFVALVKRATIADFVVSPSMALTTRPFTVPVSWSGQSTKIYVTNIPGVNGQMPAFVDGHHIRIPYQKLGAGATPGDADVGGVASDFDVPSPGGSTVHLDEDFEGYTPSADPTPWKLSGVNNDTGTGGAALWATHVDPDDANNVTFGPDGVEGNSNYHAHWNGSGAASLANYRFTGRFKRGTYATGDSGADAGIGFTVLSKYTDGTPSDTYVRVRCYGTTGGGALLHVSPHTYAAPAGGTTTSALNPALETWYRFKIEVEDDGSAQTDLRVRFWEDGTSEPPTWDIDCYWTGSGRPTTGTFGFWGYRDTAGQVHYDDLLVESLASAPAPAATATVTLDLSAADEAIAVVTVDTTTAATVPAGWTIADSSPAINGYRTFLYHTASPSGTSHTFSHATAGYIQATIAAVTGVTGAYYTNRTDYTVAADLVAPTSSAPVGPQTLVVGLYATHGDVPFGVGYSGSGTSDGAGSNMTQAAHYIYSYVDDTARGAGTLECIPDQKGTVFTWAIPSANAAGSTGIILGSVYGVVTEDTVSPREDDEQVWNLAFERVEPTNISWEFTVASDTEVLDMGLPGDGFFEASARSGVDTTPFARIATWDTNPWTPATKTLMGNLNAIGSAVGNWGFWSGHGDAEVELSDAVNRLKNVGMEFYDSNGKWLRIDGDDGITLLATPDAGVANLKYGYSYEDSLGQYFGGVLARDNLQWRYLSFSTAYRDNFSSQVTVSSIIGPSSTKTANVSLSARTNDNSHESRMLLRVLNHVTSIELEADTIRLEGELRGESTGWKPIVLASTWINHGGSWQTAQYKKVGDLIFLRGLVRRPTAYTGINDRIATLGTGYRPTADEMHPSIYKAGGSTDAPAVVKIQPNGEIRVINRDIAAGDWLSLSGIVFSTT